MRILGLVLLVLLSFNNICYAESICITEKEAIDIITLLDASERDLQLVEVCQKLAGDLYKELDERDKKVEILTKELISAKEGELKYRVSSKRWRTIAIATSATTIAVIAISVL